MKVSLEYSLPVWSSLESSLNKQAETGAVYLFSKAEGPPLSLPETDENKENSSEPKTILAPEESQALLEEILKKVEVLNRYIKMEVDKELGVTVVKIIDKKSQEVLRQIPPEYLLEVMKKFEEMLGLLVDERI